MTDDTPHERTLELLLEAVGDQAIYMLDPDGCVETWNRGAEILKGYSADEIRGQSFARFFTLDDRRTGAPQALLRRAEREGRVESEGWRVRKDGSRFWALATLHAMRDEAGGLRGFAKVTRDMTRQREQNQALVESERRFRLLVEGVVDYAIYMLDVNGVVTNWNRGAERIKGYKAKEIVGRHFSQFYTPQDRAAGRPAIALERARAEGRYEAEGWRIRKDGSRFWASVVIDPIHDDDGHLIGFAKITRDISERKAAEDALTESERQFRLLVTSVVDYAIYMLDPNGIVTSWNAGAEKAKGYTAEEIVGQHFSRFYTDADRSAGVPMRALQAASEHGRYDAEGWRVRKDGTLFWASVVLDAIRDERGVLIGFAKITRDITERRNAQQELQRAHDQLAQSQKMEALGKLTGGVAHDFNNLLMVVSGHAQLLRKRFEHDERALRALDAIETSSRRGEELTRHLLAFARRQRLHSVAFSPAEGLESIRELLTTSLPATIQLSIRTSRDVWPVEVDPSELELALLNLAVNARDAMPGGGQLALEAENIVLVGGETDEGLKGEFVAFSVADTGAGIPGDILPRIFEPFFTTKEVNKGTGLGLSQVYGFAQQSGGRVAVTSKLGEGARFTIYLPRASGAPEVRTETAAIESAVRARILVVEDNPEVAEVASSMLEHLGHETRVVGSAAAALAAVSAADVPDMVFSDIVMAGDMDGLELARRLRAEAPGVPILLATGYSQAAEHIGDEFPILRKPYKLAELSRAIGALLAGPDDGDHKLVRLDAARRAKAAPRKG